MRKKERHWMWRSRTFRERERKEEGRKEGRGRAGQQYESDQGPTEAAIDCSNFTQAVGVGCLWVRA